MLCAPGCSPLFSIKYKIVLLSFYRGVKNCLQYLVCCSTANKLQARVSPPVHPRMVWRCTNIFFFFLKLILTTLIYCSCYFAFSSLLLLSGLLKCHLKIRNWVRSRRINLDLITFVTVLFGKGVVNWLSEM